MKALREWGQTIVVVVGVLISAGITIGVTSGQVDSMQAAVEKIALSVEDQETRLTVLETMRRNDTATHAKINSNSTAIKALEIAVRLLEMGLDHLKDDFRALRMEATQ